MNVKKLVQTVEKFPTMAVYIWATNPETNELEMAQCQIDIADFTNDPVKPRYVVLTPIFDKD